MPMVYYQWIFQLIHSVSSWTRCKRTYLLCHFPVDLLPRFSKFFFFIIICQSCFIHSFKFSSQERNKITHIFPFLSRILLTWWDIRKWKVWNLESFIASFVLVKLLSVRYGQRCKMTFCRTSSFATPPNDLSDHQRFHLLLCKSHQFPMQSLISTAVLK